jgi:hypothetical protein
MRTAQRNGRGQPTVRLSPPTRPRGGGARGESIAEARQLAAIPRLALTPTEAAAALGMGLTSFKKYVQPNVRVVRRGKLRVIPVIELERWAEENAELVLDGVERNHFSDT